jgi:hypothetical protein
MKRHSPVCIIGAIRILLLEHIQIPGPPNRLPGVVLPTTSRNDPCAYRSRMILVAVVPALTWPILQLKPT